MAANDHTTDTFMDELKILAIEEQQCFYEFICDCIAYNYEEHKYLKQNIGYAIYGPPQQKSNENTEATETNGGSYGRENQNINADITDTVDYDEEAKNVINIIYNKICEQTVGKDRTKTIYVGIIYNVIILHKVKLDEKKEEKEELHKVKLDEKKEEKEETPIKKEEIKKDIKVPLLIPIPIFKIWKYTQKKTNIKLKKQGNTSSNTELSYENLYIDTGGRVYKNWIDYTKNNKLPECIMVLPKDGCYQADPSYPVTEDFSRVWLEFLDSPACALTEKLCRGMDILSNITAVGAIGLGVAAVFTPLAPVVALTGLAATGVTGAWTIGRCSQQLVDRSSHEESIDITNRDAFPQWLGIAGSAFGLGAVGGSAAITAAATRGMTINTAVRVVFNTVQGGNLVLNGIGIVYQGYCMIDNFNRGEKISYKDALSLATHIMFFAGSVVKVQFAGDVIESTQGKIIDDYKNGLRTQRLRKQFNRVKRNAATNNTCQISENAEVIRYINNRYDLLSSRVSSGTISSASSDMSSDTSSSKTFNGKSPRVIWSFTDGKLKVNDIVLLDPRILVSRLIELSLSNQSDRNSFNSQSSRSRRTNDPTAENLWNVLLNLLTQYYTSPDCPTSRNLPSMPDFESLLEELNSVNMHKSVLEKLFAIVVKLIQNSRNADEFLLRAFHFVWLYIKENMRQLGITSLRSQSFSNSVQNIIIAIFEAIDMIIDNLCNAFENFMITTLTRN